MKNNYLLLIGTAYLFIGALDLFHTMSYKGMQALSCWILIILRRSTIHLVMSKKLEIR
ncbi:MAG: hypothetical protein GX434_11550 [Peptococcaceae bacterium]|nr:hypothetical protein [Peptococcaceae bacterium]